MPPHGISFPVMLLLARPGALCAVQSCLCRSRSWRKWQAAVSFCPMIVASSTDSHTMLSCGFLELNTQDSVVSWMLIILMTVSCRTNQPQPLSSSSVPSSIAHIYMRKLENARYLILALSPQKNTALLMRTWFQTSDFQKCNKYVLFCTSKFMVIYYSDNRKLIYHVMNLHQNSLNWNSDSLFDSIRVLAKLKKKKCIQLS